MSEHIKGEWEVIRVDGVTFAQGYRCSCGVIGCRQAGSGTQASEAKPADATRRSNAQENAPTRGDE